MASPPPLTVPLLCSQALQTIMDATRPVDNLWQQRQGEIGSHHFCSLRMTLREKGCFCQLRPPLGGGVFVAQQDQHAGSPPPSAWRRYSRMVHAAPWLPSRSGGAIPVRFEISALLAGKWLRAIDKTAMPLPFTVACKGESNIHPDCRTNNLLPNPPFNLSDVEQERSIDMVRR